MAATIKDIAKLTNLSLGTISKYLNGQSVKAKNKLLLDNAVKELNYTMNEFGRNLKTNKSGIIGIIMPYLDDPFAAKIVSNIELIFRQSNYSVIVCDTLGDVKIEEEIIDFFIRKRVEGVISFPTGNESEAYHCLTDRGIDLVFIDRHVDGVDADTCLLNNREISYLATKKIIKKGHTKIGILCGAEGIHSAEERLKGYRDAHAEYGLEIREDYIRRAQYNKQDLATNEANALLNLEDRPTCIFATNYFFTLGVIMAFNEKKLRVYDDISLMGFDNIMLSNLITPKLDMVAQPMEEYASTAARILISRLAGEDIGEKKLHLCSGYIIEGNTISNLSGAEEKK